MQQRAACAGFACLMVTALVCGETAAAAKAAKTGTQTKTRATAEGVKAAEAAQQEPRKARRIVEGSVVYVSKRAISVEYEVTKEGSSEMLLPLGSNLTLEGGIKSLTELKYGDHVKVGIEQTLKDNPDGTTTLMKTEALVVVLIQRASDAAVTPATAPAVK